MPAPASLLDHPLIHRLDAQIEALQRARPDLRVIPPFFWDTSGRATIHGFITTSLKLYGEEVFLRVYDDPEFVAALHDWITGVYIAFIRHFSRLANLPVTSVHIGECSGTMLRPAHYERFVVPYASRIGRELGPVRLHSCGRSDHLLAAIAKIENLGSLDTGSNTSVAAIRARFGGDFRIDVAPPVELLLEGAERAGVVDVAGAHPGRERRRAAAHRISSGAGLLGGELRGDPRGAALARGELTLVWGKNGDWQAIPEPLEGIRDGWRCIDYQRLSAFSNVSPETRQKRDCQAVRSVLYSNMKNGDANIAVAGSDSILR